MTKNLVVVLVPFKFVTIMTHVLAILCTLSFKQDNIMSGLASDALITSDEFTAGELQ